MKVLARVLFFGYIGVFMLAGVWSIVAGRLDQHLLFGFDLKTLPPLPTTNMVSQYRFLRAVELGYGIFAMRYRDSILDGVAPFRALFLATVTLGIVARILSLVLDGIPSPIFVGFLVYEIITLIVILISSRPQVERT